jgi:hypothetical protein
VVAQSANHKPRLVYATYAAGFYSTPHSQKISRCRVVIPNACLPNIFGIITEYIRNHYRIYSESLPNIFGIITEYNELSARHRQVLTQCTVGFLDKFLKRFLDFREKHTKSCDNFRENFCENVEITMFKGTVSRDFRPLVFFHQSTLPRALTHCH